MALLRSFLYAPGSNEKLLRRVVTAGADAVVLDLEDAVAAGEKERARALVVEALDRAAADASTPPVFVRPNGLDAAIWEDDVAAVVRPGLHGLRLPKVETAEHVSRVAALVDELEAAAGLEHGVVTLTATIETARGVAACEEIARAPRVTLLAFGAVDFVRDIRGQASPEGVETLYARSRLVVAARVAGIAGPIAPFHLDLADDEGLRESSLQLRDLGFSGRTCLHPRQVPVVNEAFAPTAEELERAAAIVDEAARAEAGGCGAFVAADGTFVDRAVVEQARAVLAQAGGAR